MSIPRRRIAAMLGSTAVMIVASAALIVLPASHSSADPSMIPAPTPSSSASPLPPPLNGGVPGCC